MADLYPLLPLIAGAILLLIGLWLLTGRSGRPVSRSSRRRSAGTPGRRTGPS